MILNAIRFRPLGADAWHAYKLSSGAGRFRNYQALIGDEELLRQFIQALEYALTGKEPKTPQEAQLQLSDDGGHTWTLQRRPGFVRYLKDGAPVDGAEAQRTLTASLMDLDGMDTTTGEDGIGAANVSIERLEIRARDGRLTIAALGAPEGPAVSVKEATERQIVELAKDAARLVAVPELATPKILSQLVRKLEPLHAQYREVSRQYHDLKVEGAPSDDELKSVNKLAQEIELIKAIAETATPLLAPGAPTLKSLKDDLAKTDATLAEVCTALGLSSPDPRAAGRDFRKVIEALCRLEAHAKLVRASQGARKYCEQNIEPIHKKYLELAETSLAGDRQITSELESCLASLTLRLTTKPDGHEAIATGGLSGPGLKTWFDRFKSRQADETRPDADTNARDSQADLETARMAIEYALGRLNALGTSLTAARSRHESVLGRLDEAHEELVRSHARLRDHWLTVAREANLSDELDLNGLLRIVAGHGKLVSLADQRQELAQRVKTQATRLTTLVRLVTEWRKLTGSQKDVELDNVQVLLQEARDVIRYQEPKQKKLEQLRENQAASRAKSAIRAHLKTRAATLTAEWRAACEENEITNLQINQAGLEQLFQRAQLIRALALVHGAAEKAAPTRLFDGRTESHAATAYLWTDVATPSTQRLEFLSQLETATGGELRVLLIADESLGAMLSTLGIGMATPIKQTVTERGAAKAPEPTKAKIEAPRAGAPAPSAQRNADAAHAAALTDRAIRTLQILTGKPNGR